MAVVILVHMSVSYQELVRGRVVANPFASLLPPVVVLSQRNEYQKADYAYSERDPARNHFIFQSRCLGIEICRSKHEEFAALSTPTLIYSIGRNTCEA